MGYPTLTDRVPDRNGQNKDKKFDQIIQSILLGKKKHVPQPRRILLDQTVKNRKSGLIEIEKECAFEGITAEDLLISKFMTAITKFRDKLLKEKKVQLTKTIELIKQNTYERKMEKHPTGSPHHKPRNKWKKNQNIKRKDSR